MLVKESPDVFLSHLYVVERTRAEVLEALRGSHP